MNATFTDHPGGDIFESGADVLVCPVNCQPGVMGAGLALADLPLRVMLYPPHEVTR